MCVKKRGGGASGVSAAVAASASVSSRTIVRTRRGAGVRVLGVDPGLTRCGVGVVDGAVGRPLRLVAVEVLRTPAEADVAERLLRLAAELDARVAQHAPDVVAVERVFSQHNVRTVMGTAQAAAVAILAAARAGVPVALHTPSEVKAAVTGSGRADKAQVATMVTRLLRLPERPRPADASDALALAICQLWRGAAQARLTAALAAQPAAARPWPDGGGAEGAVAR
jgi:crossover junction endodeoxyribonuclease RuvC